MSASLRQRQGREILAYEIQEKKNNKEYETQKKRISVVHKEATSLVAKFYASVLLILMIMVTSVIAWLRPSLLPWNSKPIPKLVLASFFPSSVNKRRDLPTVIGPYVICTPENLETRQAIRYTIKQRQNLYNRQLKVFWHVWEQERADTFAKNQATHLCGDGFIELYEYSPLELQHDLVLWCLLREGSIQGLVEYGIDFYRSLPPQYRNMAVRYLGEERTLSSVLVSYPPSVSTVPSNMLTWLMEYAKYVVDWDESNYRQDLEEHLYKLIQDEKSVDWTLADAICGANRDSDTSLSSRVKLATMCHGEECCDIYEPATRQRQAIVLPNNDENSQSEREALLLRH